MFLSAVPPYPIQCRENGEVFAFIAAGSQLLRLSSMLEPLENVAVSGGGELVQLALDLFAYCMCYIIMQLEVDFRCVLDRYEHVFSSYDNP